MNESYALSDSVHILTETFKMASIFVITVCAAHMYALYCRHWPKKTGFWSAAEYNVNVGRNIEAANESYNHRVHIFLEMKQG